MTLTTVTTVGYGEIRTLSHAGRVFNSFLMSLESPSFFSASGAITQTAIELELNQFFGKRRVKNMIDKLDGHYIVCGSDASAAAPPTNSRKLGCLCRDRQERRPRGACHKIRDAGVAADASHDDTLRDLGIGRAKGLIATLANDADNLF